VVEEQTVGKTYIADLADHVGKEVMLNGWVYNKRSSGKIWFLILRDGTGYTQGVVAQKNVPNEVFNLEPALTQESSVSMAGLVKKDKRSIGGFELDVSDIKVHQIAEEYPITKKDHGTAFLMDNRHLWLRSRKQNAVLKVRAETVRAIRDYFDSNGFVNLDTPIFTANACEGTTTLFETEYFGQKAFLAQSGQLYNEANIMSFGKVYCFGPTFRAEKSKTRRHLTEFWMVEPEGWAKTVNLSKGHDVRFIVQLTALSQKCLLTKIFSLKQCGGPFTSVCCKNRCIKIHKTVAVKIITYSSYRLSSYFQDSILFP
jgi:asparaginyl-tRNA synthetase